MTNQAPSAAVLVVDDEKLTRVTLEASLTDAGFCVTAVANGFEALSALEARPFDVVLTDLRMPSMSGLELLNRIRARNGELPVIFMTAFASVKNAVEAMREGAFDYLTKPLDNEELLIRLRRAVAQHHDRQEIQRLRIDASQRLRFGDLIYRSPAMVAVVERALSVADSELTLMLQGETGTGKEVLAQAIHGHSPRARASFVVVNCGGMNPNLVESELFGHEAGAFTGAVRQRKGRLELAQGGTILVDEVDDLSMDVQLKLLRFLQEHTFERVGGNTTVRADVRILCATKRPLADLVGAGRFRDDIFYRINTIPIEIPPLRERAEDILPLAQHFGRGPSGAPLELTPDALKRLLEHRWPGNVRELEHAIEHAVVFARGQPIAIEHLPRTIQPANGGSGGNGVKLTLVDEAHVDHHALVRDLERQLIAWALERTAGNQGKAAELLGLSRTTFRGRLEATRADGEPAPAAPREDVGPEGAHLTTRTELGSPRPRTNRSPREPSGD